MSRERRQGHPELGRVEGRRAAEPRSLRMVGLHAGVGDQIAAAELFAPRADALEDRAKGVGLADKAKAEVFVGVGIADEPAEWIAQFPEQRRQMPGQDGILPVATPVEMEIEAVPTAGQVPVLAADDGGCRCSHRGPVLDCGQGDHRFVGPAAGPAQVLGAGSGVQDHRAVAV